MIAMLVGTPVFSADGFVMLCAGVGYGVATSERTASQLRSKTEATLFIHTHVREDALSLFGFSRVEDKHMFELLLGVSGVGPKTALAITNSEVEHIMSAIQTSDVSFFTSFSRVGKKVAQKIIIELKSKLGSLTELDLADESAPAKEVREALEVLGYEKREIQRVLHGLNIETLSPQEAIKLCVRKLSAFR